jgi:hypothetical protein
MKYLSNSSELEGVLFEIEADPHVEGIKSFSHIKSYSFTGQEDEILFMIGSIFQSLKVIQKMKKNFTFIW